MIRSLALCALGLLLSACDDMPNASSTTSSSSVPEEVIAVADPRHVGTARLLDDGCYWYVHDNVVETTFLPLRTPDGRPICAVSRAERDARAAEAAQAAAGAAPEV